MDRPVCLILAFVFALLVHATLAEADEFIPLERGDSVLSKGIRTDYCGVACARPNAPRWVSRCRQCVWSVLAHGGEI